jgi:N-acetylglucosaminyl-diphospho-decaprenol L-rhamnosyltransferase
VIVDNGSTDGTAELIERESKWASVVITGNNNGFAKGCNIGLRQVQTPFIVFINPDAVVEPASVRTMLTFMNERSQSGIVGPAIIETSGTLNNSVLQVTGRRPTPWTIIRDAMPFRRGRSSFQPIIPGSAPFETEWVCGAVLMARTDLIRNLGGFDSRFFLYWEEMDICLRAERAGAEIWALGTATAAHVGGASSIADEDRIGGCIPSHYFQSRYYYMRKHYGWAAATAAEIIELTLLVVHGVANIVRGRDCPQLRARLQARLLSSPSRL